jgi:hydrogenase-4 component B
MMRAGNELPVITIVIAWIALLLVAGVLSIFLHRTRGSAVVPGIIGASALGIFVYVLVHFKSTVIESTVRIAWSLPSGSLLAGIDSLTGFFLLPLLLLTACSALYGPRYLEGHSSGRFHWLYYSLLAAGMTGVLIARNAVFFLLAWEIMSLSSFLLVISDGKQARAVRAGWIYFVTAHIGTAFIFALFFTLSATAGPMAAGSLDFSAWHCGALGPAGASLVFLLALVGFGLKAGFIPFHVWLPLAHPEAPSHVSALMSGIMIKMGIYGILRILSMLSPFQVWWGVLLIGLGAFSAVLGVLFAIGQHDLKRLLAYHSVENIGIILLGIGLSVLGSACGMPQLALLGIAGALLHVVNHALFKSLLFLGAGSVIRQTGTGDLNRLGGLIRTMPATAVFFLCGSIAICGLPFFNGFMSELLIYSGAITGAITGAINGTLHPTTTGFALSCLAVVLSLALTGGLAAACFTKVFGMVFLGEPREPRPARGEVPAPMLGAMAVLAFSCLFIGLAAVLIMPGVVQVALPFAGLSGLAGAAPLIALAGKVTLALGFIMAGMVVVALIIAVIRPGALARKTVTWDCGYSKPAPSMQYTASSFAAPITGYFARLLGGTGMKPEPELFPPADRSFHATVKDWYLTAVYAPAARFLDRVFSPLRWFQNGKSGLYVAYIALALCAIIIWKFFP